MSQSEKKEFDIVDFAAQVSKIIEKNFKLLAGIFGTLIVVAIAWTIMESAAQRRQEEAFTELYKITKIYQEKKDNFTKAKEQAEKKKDPKADKESETAKEDENLQLASGDINKDYGEEVTKLTLFIDGNLGKNASGEAALVLSEIYDEYNQQDKGAEILSKVLKDWSDKNVIYYVMQMRTGDLWAAGDQCDKAASYWQVVANSESFIARQAQLKLGVCLQKIGQMDEAKKWFQTIKDKDPNSSEGFSAKRYLRFLEFKTKAGSEASEEKAQTPQKSEDKKS